MARTTLNIRVLSERRTVQKVVTLYEKVGKIYPFFRKRYTNYFTQTPKGTQTTLPKYTNYFTFNRGGLMRTYITYIKKNRPIIRNGGRFIVGL